VTFSFYTVGTMPTLSGNVSYTHMKHVVCTLHLTDNYQITYVPAELTLYIAAVGTAWSPLGAPRNGLAVLYLFRKHLLSWECIDSVSHCGRL